MKKKTIKSEIAFNGHFLKIKRDQIEQSDGQTYSREYFEHPGASLIVPILPDGRLLFIQQYRHAMKSIFIEFPAGKRDPNEGYEETARRELLEETGYLASKLEFMCTIHPVISYSTEQIDCYFARNLILQKRNLDPGENIELLPMTLKDSLAQLKAGKITDVKTMIALLWYEKWAQG
ncbi:MAG TPA: NUDIX hydrolase [Pseudobdellovibrionaceae bacterium]|nr:NUDIX hydrolase [Pseudobdellovibrionaceae bacterium]